MRRPVHTPNLTPTLTLTLTPMPTLTLTLTLALALALSVPSQLFVAKRVRERNHEDITWPFSYTLAVHALAGLGRSFHALEHH